MLKRTKCFFMAFAMIASVFSTIAQPIKVNAANEQDNIQWQADPAPEVVDAFKSYKTIGAVSSHTQDGNVTNVALDDGNNLKITVLANNVVRVQLEMEGKEFTEYPAPRDPSHEATIRTTTDAKYIANKSTNAPTVEDDGTTLTITTGTHTLEIEKATSKMKFSENGGTVVWEETKPLRYEGDSTVQALKTDANEYFFGGGTQNGRFSHKNETIKIVNSNNWVDQGVASPNPFYLSTDGYGVLRNTFAQGEYDFGEINGNEITTVHNEGRFDAYYFADTTDEKVINEYYELTGYPVELPEYAGYLGHLNAYNRDYWELVDATTPGAQFYDGKWYKEVGDKPTTGSIQETLFDVDGNGNAVPDSLSAIDVINEHKRLDMPLAWFLPNDGYGCGYGQTDTFAGDIQNLTDFAKLAVDKGVETGLWVQSNLWPADPANPQKAERDIKKEVAAGVKAIKTDVAWVGAGYSMALDGVKKGFDATVEFANAKPNIVSLDGWAGTQRYAGIWSGDQYGGDWEYIRFHIPTYIGTSLSGQPNIGSDLDGIFGGQNPTIAMRDFQWKSFSSYLLDMDGWGSSPKTPWAMSEPGTSINRAYLKLKAQLMPYVNTISHEATTVGGTPMIRPMFMEEASDFTHGTETEYQYMWGDSFLVAPIYQIGRAHV